MLLEDQVAIISGIGPGLGQELADVFAREGAHVVLAARTRSKLEELPRQDRPELARSPDVGVADRHQRQGAFAAEAGPASR